MLDYVFWSLIIAAAFSTNSVASAQNCYRPEIPANATIRPDSSIYLTNTTVTYKCDAGYTPVEGNSTRTCGDSGSWSGTAPLCTLTDGICGGTTLSDGKCLTLDRHARSWSDAKKRCGKNPGLLITLSDDSVVAAAKELLTNNYIDNAWIAAYSYRVWQWTDNTEITEFSWINGEPTKLDGKNFIQLRKEDGYRWNIASGSDVYDGSNDWSVNKYVCQYDGDCQSIRFVDPHMSLNGSCFEFQAKDLHEDHDGRCVSWNQERPNHKDPNYWVKYCNARGINWQDANTKCAASGGRLAKADTKYISDSLTSYISTKAGQERRFAGNYWIGGSTKDLFKWKWGDSDNITSSLAVPNIVNKTCGSLDKSGTIGAIDCSWWLPSYLCVTELPETPVRCGTPPQAPDTKPTILSSQKVPGDTILQQCAAGYRTDAAFACYCLASGRWDGYCGSSVSCTAMQTTIPTVRSSIVTPSPANTSSPLSSTQTGTIGGSTAQLLSSTSATMTSSRYLNSSATTTLVALTVSSSTPAVTTATPAVATTTLAVTPTTPVAITSAPAVTTATPAVATTTLAVTPTTPVAITSAPAVTTATPAVATTTLAVTTTTPVAIATTQVIATTTSGLANTTATVNNTTLSAGNTTII